MLPANIVAVMTIVGRLPMPPLKLLPSDDHAWQKRRSFYNMKYLTVFRVVFTHSKIGVLEYYSIVMGYFAMHTHSTVNTMLRIRKSFMTRKLSRPITNIISTKTEGGSDIQRNRHKNQQWFLCMYFCFGSGKNDIHCFFVSFVFLLMTGLDLS